MPSLDAATRLEAALRRSLATDLHDDPLQALAAVAMGLELLRMQRGDDPELAEIEEIAREATKRLRRMLAEITGPETDIPLAEALEAHFADLGAGSALEIDGDVPPRLRTVVALLASEAAVAGATRIRVSGHEAGATLRVDGPAEGDLELASARAELAGGSCRRDGAAVEITLPA